MIKSRNLKCIGQVLRMDNTRICITALTWQPEGKGKVGRPNTRWRRTTEREKTARIEHLSVCVGSDKR
jgi:hypothetical protein